MAKTPVSMLQEMMMKKCIVPNYQLIHNGGGTHVNTFTYQVSCDGLTATGTGRCKKDAKHEAAKAMLDNIAKVNNYPQLPASPAQSPIHTPLPPQPPVAVKTPAHVPFINTIGALQELCADNNLHEPKYEKISEVGPPHARVFTIHCIVSTFKEEGIATTKKQAKHEAAKKMLDRITEVVAGKMQDISQCIKQEKIDMLDANEIAKNRYPDLTKLPVIKKPNLGLKISDYHETIKKSVSEDVRTIAIQQLVDLINDAKLESNSDAEYESICTKFREMLMPLNIHLEEICLSAIAGAGSLAGISLDTSPALIELDYAENKSKAKISALLKVMNTLHTLLL